MKRHAAPIIAAILLLLPVLYVGSYLALVTPGGTAVGSIKINYVPYPVIDHYRAGGDISGAIFWPLEQIDRKVRPGAWEQPSWERPEVYNGQFISP
jgi:hypothetical protein